MEITHTPGYHSNGPNTVIPDAVPDLGQSCREDRQNWPLLKSLCMTAEQINRGIGGTTTKCTPRPIRTQPWELVQRRHKCRPRRLLHVNAKWKILWETKASTTSKRREIAGPGGGI
jgi:hypothetical protein